MESSKDMVMKEFIQRLFLDITSRVARFVGKIHMPYSRKKLSSKHVRELEQILKPGMILLSHTRGEFSNYFIPGFWAHVAIVDDNHDVIEAVAKGVVMTDLIDFVMTKDAVMVVDALFIHEDQRMAVVEEARKHLGKPYDFELVQSNIEKFYCSELAYLSLKAASGELPFTLRKTLGRYTITPQDFENAKAKFDTIYDSRK